MSGGGSNADELRSSRLRHSSQAFGADTTTEEWRRLIADLDRQTGAGAAAAPADAQLTADFCVRSAGPSHCVPPLQQQRRRCERRQLIGSRVRGRRAVCCERRRCHSLTAAKGPSQVVRRRRRRRRRRRTSSSHFRTNQKPSQ